MFLEISQFIDKLIVVPDGVDIMTCSASHNLQSFKPELNALNQELISAISDPYTPDLARVRKAIVSGKYEKKNMCITSLFNE